jgi:flagellar hook assembly protein FlgD
MTNKFGLEQNYPNPFNPTTTIQFTVPEFGNAKLEIFNPLGQLVHRIILEDLNRGIHSCTWDAVGKTGNTLSSGIYIYKFSFSGISGNTFSHSKKMVLLK